MHVLPGLLAVLTSISCSHGVAVETKAASPYPLVVTEPPTFVRPYVIPYLNGPAVQLIDDVIRFPINNESSGGSFTLLQLNAQNYIRSGYDDLFQAPRHYHTRFHVRIPNCAFFSDFDLILESRVTPGTQP